MKSRRLLSLSHLPTSQSYHIFCTITHPPQIWEENGGASYSPNVAYVARCGGGAAVEWVFFLFSSSKT